MRKFALLRGTPALHVLWDVPFTIPLGWDACPTCPVRRVVLLSNWDEM
ncbi:unnamed protein product [marine sediment metagenome]|uniref:Uncharacterized protein n=1 Tax=marine sediment metagenome TaxID=412755 RepID=X0RN33_9ZZZZ